MNKNSKPISVAALSSKKEPGAKSAAQNIASGSSISISDSSSDEGNSQSKQGSKKGGKKKGKSGGPGSGDAESSDGIDIVDKIEAALTKKKTMIMSKKRGKQPTVSLQSSDGEEFKSDVPSEYRDQEEAPVDPN